MLQKNLLFTLLICLVSFYAGAQSNKEKATKLHAEAIELMDQKGDFEGAIKLLEQAKELEPKNQDHIYEMAYAYYYLKNYDKAKDIIVEVVRDKNSTFRHYQLLGNIYDIQGEPEKALGVYKEGLKKWPNDGHLYNEMAIVEMGRKDYNTAMGYWEKGIEVEPEFASNYYWAAKIYAQTDSKLWALMYGEIFMNLERNTKRTSEMSAILYNTYQNCITIGDTTAEVKFMKDNVLRLNSKNIKKMKLPFSMHYETGMLVVISKYVIDKKKTLSLNDLSDIRTAFLKIWYEKKLPKDYPNIVLEFHKKLLDKDYLESYSHWIMMKGDEEAFTSWYKDHKESFEGFMTWFKANPMPVDKKHFFLNTQYD